MKKPLLIAVSTGVLAFLFMVLYLMKDVMMHCCQQGFHLSIYSYYLSNCGPEGINALAASLSQYCSKFLMYLAASDFAFVSQSETLA